MTLDWLLAPASGAATHTIAPAVYWHARLMVLAWSLLLPLGVLLARFYKITPGQRWPEVLDSKFWWHAHRGLQYAGSLLLLPAVFLVWRQRHGAGALAFWHGALGWCLLALALAQIASGWARGSKGGPTGAQLRGDHYDMSLRRRAFERLHKGLGYLALLFAVVATALGLALADAPRWMWLLLALWWLLLAGAFALLQLQGRCVDTYQAIWGPDTGTAASRRPALGWGVRRYSAAGWQQKFGPARSGKQHRTTGDKP